MFFGFFFFCPVKTRSAKSPSVCAYEVGQVLFCSLYTELSKHYKNMPIQTYRKFHLKKTVNFKIKTSDKFYYFCSKHRLWVFFRTACTHNLCFWAETRKIIYTPVNPVLLHKWFKGVKIIQVCYRDVTLIYIPVDDRGYKVTIFLISLQKHEVF